MRADGVPYTSYLHNVQCVRYIAGCAYSSFPQRRNNERQQHWPTACVNIMNDIFAVETRQGGITFAISSSSTRAHVPDDAVVRRFIARTAAPDASAAVPGIHKRPASVLTTPLTPPAPETAWFCNGPSLPSPCSSLWCARIDIICTSCNSQPYTVCYTGIYRARGKRLYDG